VSLYIVVAIGTLANNDHIVIKDSLAALHFFTLVIEWSVGIDGVFSFFSSSYDVLIVVMALVDRRPFPYQSFVIVLPFSYRVGRPILLGSYHVVTL